MRPATRLKLQTEGFEDANAKIAFGVVNNGRGDTAEGANIEKESPNHAVTESGRAELGIGEMKDETEDEKETKKNCGFKEQKGKHEQTHGVFCRHHLGYVVFKA